MRKIFLSGLFGGLFKRSAKESKNKKESTPTTPPSSEPIPSQPAEVRKPEGNCWFLFLLFSKNKVMCQDNRFYAFVLK